MKAHGARFVFFFRGFSCSRLYLGRKLEPCNVHASFPLRLRSPSHKRSGCCLMTLPTNLANHHSRLLYITHDQKPAACTSRTCLYLYEQEAGLYCQVIAGREQGATSVFLQCRPSLSNIFIHPIDCEHCVMPHRDIIGPSKAHMVLSYPLLPRLTHLPR